MTYSIVARDKDTGEFGVAVQSHYFQVGPTVPWAIAGVGAVATQSMVNVSFGPLGLDYLKAGYSATQALKALLAGDSQPESRQVSLVDADGNVATHTGAKCIPAAGHRIGDGFSVQANLMEKDTVWDAMFEAYTSSKEPLAERMMAALEAAEAEGGDIRGKQSAALIVVAAKSTGRPWQDRVFDLRVDDAPLPLDELHRLVALQRAYNHMNAGDLAVEHKDNEAALREYSAAEQIASTTSGIPQSRYAEMLYWHAVALVNMKRVDESLPIFAKAFKLEPSWRELTPRLPHSGLLPDDTKLIERIVAAGR